MPGKIQKSMVRFPELFSRSSFIKKFWLAGLLTRQTIVAFPIPGTREKWRVLQLIQNDLQLRAQYRFFTGFPLSEKFATNRCKCTC